MKKHTTYYVIGAVLIGAGAFLYFKKKDTNTINLNPPQEVVEEDKKTTPELATPPYVSAFDTIQKILDMIKSNKANASVPTNTTV